VEAMVEAPAAASAGAMVEASAEVKALIQTV